MGPRSDEDLIAERSASLDAILTSNDLRKVVVAGPGTGKTFTFKRLLEKTEPPTLVLTFIRNLVSDLQDALGAIADVYTFHGFARWLLHSRGIIPGVHYYPFLTDIIDSDLHWIGPEDVSTDDIERSIRSLDEGSETIGVAERSSEYYRAVGHDLAVFRVLKHFQKNPADILAYNQVVVDEYQDFNRLEVALIDELTRKSPVLVVGDDDQALYAFKLASPDYLRELHEGSGWSSFNLPFCSRCPLVVVDATHRLVQEAQRRGLLSDRIDKPFECFLPSKGADSEKYPKLIHARCSVHMKKAPYMARYVEEQVRSMYEQDVRDSRNDGNPTVLVIGPAYITGPVYDHLELMFPDVVMKTSPETGLSAQDGYELLLRDSKSRLGWRIITMLDLPSNMEEILQRALVDGEELADLLPEDFRKRHLRVVALIRKVRNREPLTDEEQAYVEARTGLAVEELIPPPDEEPPLDDVGMESPADDGESDELVPSIVLTGSLIASKGLQGEHVFILGVQAGDLPKNPGAPTDSEVCQLLVALTRAKKSCHLVTADRLFGQPRTRSPFIDWLGDLVQQVYVNKDYFAD
jgi:hypothetical protein